MTMEMDKIIQNEQKKNRLIYAENKLMITKGEGSWGAG